jgi:hypothetical protein
MTQKVFSLLRRIPVASSIFLCPGATRSHSSWAEVGVSRSGGHNEHVIRDTSLAHFDLGRTPIDLRYSPEQYRRVALSPQNGADRHRDLDRREPGGGDLIKQRLKEVIIPSVDDGHVDGGRAPWRLSVRRTPHQ